MVINTNQAALTASTALRGSSASLARSLARLSAGAKIISASDDSAGLACSMKMGAQVARLGAVANNLSNALSFEQTQDGYLAKIGDTLNRMGELAMLALDPTKSADDRKDYDFEYQELGADLEATGNKNFNGVPLFDGKSLKVTVDADANTFTMNGISANSFTTFTGYDSLLNFNVSLAALGYVKTAILAVAGYRAQIGASEETLAFYSDQVSTLKNNLSTATSRIMDVDVAQESVNYARASLRTQTGTAMLAQANLQPQAVLKLLG